MMQRSSYPCDLAISAVASDGGLVAELTRELAARLATVPEWQNGHAAASAEPGLLLSADHSRVALVLHQHLWDHDARTRRDAPALRARMTARQGSLCVLSLDESAITGWLADAPCYRVGESGRAGAADFVVDMIAAAGGAVRPKPQPVVLDEPVPRWSEPPTPFVAQPRAHSALRHELDGIVAALTREVERARAAHPDGTFELLALPHRAVARFDDVAISFSWVTTGLASVADGRMLVIAWHGVANGVRGIPALKSATVLHERVYVAEGDAPGAWSWRAQDLARQPYSSVLLVEDWVARAGVARACIAQDGGRR